jgi:hypothetical protein
MLSSPPTVQSMENEYTHVIAWSDKLRGSSGQGKKLFTRNEAEELANELNQDFPNFIHEAVEVMPDNESQAQLSAADSKIIGNTDFNSLSDKKLASPVPFNKAA